MVMIVTTLDIQPEQRITSSEAYNYSKRDRMDLTGAAQTLIREV